MEQSRRLQSGDHEGSTLLHSRQGAADPDGSDSAQSAMCFPEQDSSLDPDAWKEFEVRRRSAEYYLSRYLESLDRIGQTCVDSDMSPPQALSIPSQMQTDRDVARLKISSDTAIRDLIVMERILYQIQENSRLHSQTVSHVAAICPSHTVTARLYAVSAVTIPVKVAAGLSAVGAVAGTLFLTAPPVLRTIQSHNVGNALTRVQNLKRAFTERTIGEGNLHDLDQSRFSFLKWAMSTGP
ncbi:hypothetical protein CEP54_014471 [Fusarium duplospermum]|uniref:Uncharacterized protein n=1 Tax=Fusarium duplospermum TaxID=1325734 RepID=A0A428NW25_9HYPO|nr:hypothetical protein CEP54_014471 [Fusarium duplospermum]